MPIVSVIIPIYNVEKYLKRCVDSVVNQTLKDIEIILVDDGSPDNCPKICDEYAKKDKRVIVIHKKNGGLSEARNSGIKIATGEYMTFVDSDDFIEIDMLFSTVSYAKNNNLDIVTSGKSMDFEKENYSVVESFERTEMFEKNDLAQGIFKICNSGNFNVVWNKLYKTNFIKENHFMFIPDAMPMEDVAFNAPCFIAVEKIGVIDKAFYHYIKLDNDTYITKYSDKIYDVFVKRYDYFSRLFNHFKLNDIDSVKWLNAQYIMGLMDCIINMYRKGSPLKFKDKIQFVKMHILNDSKAKMVFKENKQEDILSKIFAFTFKVGSPLFLILFYNSLFFFKKNMKTLYKKFRKKSKKNRN